MPGPSLKQNDATDPSSSSSLLPAGINFEHSGVDGHTVLRYAADVYTELVLLFAKVRPSVVSICCVRLLLISSLLQSINSSAPTLFKARLSPHAKSYKSKNKNEVKEPEEELDTVPKVNPFLPVLFSSARD